MLKGFLKTNLSLLAILGLTTPSVGEDIEVNTTILMPQTTWYCDAPRYLYQLLTENEEAEYPHCRKLKSSTLVKIKGIVPLVSGSQLLGFALQVSVEQFGTQYVMYELMYSGGQEV